MCGVREQCPLTHGQVAKLTSRSSAANKTLTQLQLWLNRAEEDVCVHPFQPEKQSVCVQGDEKWMGENKRGTTMPLMKVCVRNRGRQKCMWWVGVCDHSSLCFQGEGMKRRFRLSVPEKDLLFDRPLSMIVRVHSPEDIRHETDSTFICRTV